MPKSEATELTQTFTTTLQNGHTYAIKWLCLGDQTKPPLIFIHGEPWSSRLWSPFALAFSKHFSVYIFDNPGYGETQEISSLDSGARDVSLATQGEAFACLLTSWDIPAPHVVAHDYGGLIALRAKLVHGATYASLCLVDPLALTPWGSPFFRLILSHESIFGRINPPIFEGMLRAYIEQAAHKPLAKDVMDTILQPWLESRGGKQGQAGFFAQIAQCREEHAEEIMGRYGEVGQDLPVKIIWGKEDNLIPVDRAEKLAIAVRAKEVVIIEEAGHLVMLDQPEQLGVELSKWLFCNVTSGTELSNAPA